MAFPPRTPRDPVHDKSGWTRLGGLGFELVAAVLGFALAGVWVDRRYDTAPWGVVIGAILGIVGGLYNLVKHELAGARAARRQDRAAAAQKETEKEAAASAREAPGPAGEPAAGDSN